MRRLRVLPLCLPSSGKYNYRGRYAFVEIPPKGYPAVGGPLRVRLVSEYDADELADDSDDEKKIEKAEKAAERKAAIAKKKRGRSAQQSTGFGREAPLNQ